MCRDQPVCTACGRMTALWSRWSASQKASLPSGSAADSALDSSTDPMPATADPAGRGCWLETAIEAWLRDGISCKQARDAQAIGPQCAALGMVRPQDELRLKRGGL